jgi:4-amino-4-deoxy-L-arabinose transferase-like glycosyltransferase
MIREQHYPILIAAIGLLFFVPFLGYVHLFDWDEINFAESSREMIVSGDYFRVQIGFKPFWEKPPLFFWLQAASMQLFGITEFSARLPNAIFGIITLVTIFYIGRRERNTQFGLLWVLLYFGSLLPHLYFKSGIIDPVFNFFIFTSAYFLKLSLNGVKKRLRYAIYSGILIGFAVLTKGPVGFLLLLLTFLVVLVVQRFRFLPRLRDVLGFAAAAFLISLFWYGFELAKNGPWFLVEFINYQVALFRSPVADHSQPFYYHFVVVFFGCFPMSVIALGGFRKSQVDSYFDQWMMALFWVVMILFTIVTTKIVHYSSMAYLPLSYIAAHYMLGKLTGNLKFPKVVVFTFLVVGLVMGSLLTALPLVNVFRSQLVPFIHDPFAVAGIMKNVPWGGFEYLIGVGFMVMVVVSTWFLYVGRTFKAVLLMSANTAATLFLYLIFVLPKVESHTQGSLIDFLERVRHEDAYVITHGFHSYAPYFYFEQPNDNLEKRADKNWLLTGKIDKPVYVIAKITDTYLQEREDLILISEEGGFRFYQRLPSP